MSEVVNDEKSFMDNWEGERETKQPDNVQPETTEPKKEEAKKEEVKEKQKLPPDLASEILIGAVDGTQTILFNAFLKRKIRRRFDGDEIAKCEKWMRQIADKAINRKDLPDADYDLLYRYEALKEVHEDIPFTDEEYEKLKKPLSKLIEINNYDIPPGVALTIAVAEVLAPRIADAIFE